jgi:hypothetical protein
MTSHTAPFSENMFVGTLMLSFSLRVKTYNGERGMKLMSLDMQVYEMNLPFSTVRNEAGRIHFFFVCLF